MKVLLERCGAGTVLRMSTARKLITTPAPDDDAGTVGNDGALTVKQESFVRHWVYTGNKAAAYRLAYDVSPDTAPGTVWSCASRIAALPAVQKRYEEIAQQASLEVIVSIQAALQHQLDIATADPNEIAYVAKRACRNCYGNGHKHQWTDADEYTEACVEAIEAKKMPPLDEGGYGYNRGREPALDCPHCLGNGVPENVINDTRNLQGKARKLFKGLDYKSGEWVVLMHDQAKAWEMVCRILGAFNDKLKLDLPGGHSKSAKIPDGAVSEQEAARAYLTLIG